MAGPVMAGPVMAGHGLARQRKVYMPACFCFGLDLGKLADFSALAGIEQTRKPHPTNPDRTETHYFVGYLKRFPLRTPYVSQPGSGQIGIVESVKAILSREAFANSLLAIDQTGVGVAVVDFFRRAQLPCGLRPITITAGSAISRNPAENGWHVPKKELVSTLEVLMQNRRLTVARGIPESELLKAELQNFQAKMSASGHESTGAWREGEHDDLVLAVCLAVWLAEHAALGWGGQLGLPGDSERRGNCAAARAPRGIFDQPGEW